MKDQLESTRKELHKDFNYHKEINEKSIQSHAEEKKKSLEEMNQAVSLEKERVKLLHKTELE